MIGTTDVNKYMSIFNSICNVPFMLGVLSFVAVIRETYQERLTKRDQQTQQWVYAM